MFSTLRTCINSSVGEIGLKGSGILSSISTFFLFEQPASVGMHTITAIDHTLNIAREQPDDPFLNSFDDTPTIGCPVYYPYR
jgi:hypothetical protein